MSEWKRYKLGEIREDISYGYTESASKEVVGPKFLRITDIQYDFIDWDKVPYCTITDENYQKFKLGYGDLVIARTGALTGTTAIFKDEKIELNQQMNQTLEAMAQAIFKEWFVDFKFPKSSESGFAGLKDDRIKKENNKKILKSYNLENPDSDNLPHGLPKRWKMGKVGDILQPKRGKNITKSEAIEGIFPVVAGGLEPSCYHNESNTKEPVITISSSGANAGFVRLYQTPVWSADSCFIDSTIFPFVYYCYIFLKSNQKNIYDSQEGSEQPHIYPRHIMDLNICVGNEAIVQRFEEIVTPLFEKIKYNSLQIQTLTQIRDTLLPKLMSGRIEVK